MNISYMVTQIVHTATNMDGCLHFSVSITLLRYFFPPRYWSKIEFISFEINNLVIITHKMGMLLQKSKILK